VAHPIYQSTQSEDCLSQGDILLAQKLHHTLLGHQDYIAKQPYFRHFVVLTQSCDLDRSRETADFVTLAVVRTLDEAIGRRQVDSKDTLRDLLRDLYLHQYNKRGFFLLPANPEHSIDTDSVVDLRVVFSVHRDHYGALLAARQAAMNPVYAAQLGSLFGHMFNRVAVAGWEDTGATTDLKNHVKTSLTAFEEKENARRDEILHMYDYKCCIAGCDVRASTYRWVRIGTAYSIVSSIELAICSSHARALDRNELPQEVKLRPDRGNSATEA
jgi:hypothetical protein